MQISFLNNGWCQQNINPTVILGQFSLYIPFVTNFPILMRQLLFEAHEEKVSMTVFHAELAVARRKEILFFSRSSILKSNLFLSQN
jgi:hypothetical protein